MEILNLLVGLLEALGTIIGAIFIAQQIKLSREHNDKNIHIQKIKETLLAHNDFREKIRELDNTLREKFSIQSSLDKVSIEQIQLANDLTLNSLKIVFSYLNRISTGIKLGIYDKETINELAGYAIIQYFDRYYNYIEKVRENSKDYYIDLEYFVNDLKTIKNYNLNKPSSIF
jgi:hypothetical protein